MYRLRRNSNRNISRIARIEKKCNRILSELLIIHQQLMNRPDELDSAIDCMHRAARKMRSQSERERDIVNEMFISRAGRR